MEFELDFKETDPIDEKYTHIEEYIYQQKKDQFFYFVDETGDLHGPYQTAQIARIAQQVYPAWLDGAISESMAQALDKVLRFPV